MLTKCYNLFDDIYKLQNELSYFWRDPMPVEIKEEKEKITIELEVPGFTEEDLKIETKDGVLHISAERKEKNRTRKLSRSFLLPKDAEADKIEATLERGLLFLTIPKLPENVPKKIEIKVVSK